MREPEAVGLSSERLGRARPAIEKYITEDKIAGAVTLLARRGQIVHLECYGNSSRESGSPMKQDSLFRIYSMTKPVTCAALLMLYEQGEFQLTNPVSRFIPGIDSMMVFDGTDYVNQSRQMNIWHLLTHTSGLTYPGSVPGPIAEAYNKHIHLSNTSLQDLVEGILKTPLVFQPGTRFMYGFSQDVAARLVEIISGKSFGEFLQDELLIPLGMNDTGFYVPPGKAARLTSMYGAFNIDVESTPEENAKALEENWNVLLSDSESDYVTKPHNSFRGGHGLVSTAQDYYRFCAALLGKGEFEGVRVLGRKTVELMCLNHLPPELLPYDIGGMVQPGLGYGLGVRVMLDPGMAHIAGSVGEFGWGGAASTYFWIDPVEELIGIQMAQYQPAGKYQIGTDFRTTTYQSIID
ncbi:MAG: beta-lactamase family protein [Spirochaetales bacterium]|jgi:CubicO group peptidase (beta-lactamase class C family)|nr:beta-lactamase family protein [Spirochaetales bacterium]